MDETDFTFDAVLQMRAMASRWSSMPTVGDKIVGLAGADWVHNQIAQDEGLWQVVS